MLTSQFFIGVLGLAVLITGRFPYPPPFRSPRSYTAWYKGIVGQKRLPHPKGYIEIGGEEDYVQVTC